MIGFTCFSLWHMIGSGTVGSRLQYVSSSRTTGYSYTGGGSHMVKVSVFPYFQSISRYIGKMVLC